MSRELIASVLKKKRKKSNLSVEEVAQKLKLQYEIDVSPKSVYSYESGHRQPDADTLMALCDIYGISDVMGEFGYTNDDDSTDIANDESADIAIELYKLLISAGWVKEGEDLTDKQFKTLQAVCLLLDVSFDATE